MQPRWRMGRKAESRYYVLDGTIAGQADAGDRYAVLASGVQNLYQHPHINGRGLSDV